MPAASVQLYDLVDYISGTPPRLSPPPDRSEGTGRFAPAGITQHSFLYPIQPALIRNHNPSEMAMVSVSATQEGKHGEEGTHPRLHLYSDASDLYYSEHTADWGPY